MGRWEEGVVAVTSSQLRWYRLAVKDDGLEDVCHEREVVTVMVSLHGGDVDNHDVTNSLEVGRSAGFSVENTTKSLRCERHEVKYYWELEDLNHVGVKVGGHHVVDRADVVSKRGQIRRSRDVWSRVIVGYVRWAGGRESHELVRLPVTAICRNGDSSVVVGLANVAQTVHEGGVTSRDIRASIGHLTRGATMMPVEDGNYRDSGRFIRTLRRSGDM
jgi:hypothetical protein